MAEPKEMYTVVGEKNGCVTCGHGEFFNIVFDNEGPEEEAESVAYEDKEHAEDICRMLNDAFAKGLRAGLHGSEIPTFCIRSRGHDGPCNGLPRKDCPGYAAWAGKA